MCAKQKTWFYEWTNNFTNFTSFFSNVQIWKRILFRKCNRIGYLILQDFVYGLYVWTDEQEYVFFLKQKLLR